MRQSTTTFGNNLVETKTYRNDGNLKDNLTSTISIPGVTNFTYTWDANKRKKIEADTSIPTNTQNYNYDNEDRLTSFTRDNGDSQSWNLSLVGDWNTFNANGNLQTRTHDFVHELTAINATALTYDVKGNLTQNSNAQTYTWDYENRMKSAVVGADTPAVTLVSPATVASERAPISGRRASATPSGIDTRPPRARVARSPAASPCQKARMTSIMPVTSAQAAMHSVSTSAVRPGHSKATKPAANESRARNRYPATGPVRSLLNARAASLPAAINA